MPNNLATSLFALSTTLVTPAFADVTAADVWANQQSLYGALGGTLSGELSGDGTVSPVASFILPNGFGSFQIKLGQIALSENADGSVTIDFPSPLKASFAGGITGEGSFNAELILTNESYRSIATGDPGDISYETNAKDLMVELVETSLEGVEGARFSGTGTYALDQFSYSTRVREGNLIDYTVEANVGTSISEFAFATDNVITTTSQTMQPVSGSGAISLPVGGTDVMNISQALRDGLSVFLESTAQGNSSVTTVTLNGEVLNTQETSSGLQKTSVTFDENGIVIDGQADSLSVSLNDPLIFPAPLAFDVASISSAIAMPVNASEEVKDLRIAASLDGITIADRIWGMFDPVGQLPRDPANISFDITGLGKNGLDLLDFAALSTLAGPPPIQVDEVTIENLNIDAIGAEVAAKGTMTFDWTDFQTFAGIPRPEGAVTINLNGANKLMDTLVAMGFIPEDQLLMPRMMMGMFATPVGDDMLESVIEVNAEGHLLANGQRLQ